MAIMLIIVNHKAYRLFEPDLAFNEATKARNINTYRTIREGGQCSAGWWAACVFPQYRQYV